MKRLAATLALLLAAQVARADEDAAEVQVEVPLQLLQTAVARRHQPQLLALADARIDRARTERNVGIAHVVIGTIMTGVGVGLFMEGFCFDNCSNRADGAFEASIGLLTLGQIGVFSGIPLWAVGQSRKTRAERVKLSLSVSGGTIEF